MSDIRTIKSSLVVCGLFAYAVISDIMSGRHRRFTVHAIRLLGDKSTKVLGRELTLADARKVIAKHIDGDGQ